MGEIKGYTYVYLEKTIRLILGHIASPLFVYGDQTRESFNPPYCRVCLSHSPTTSTTKLRAVRCICPTAQQFLTNLKQVPASQHRPPADISPNGFRTWENLPVEIRVAMGSTHESALDEVATV